MFERFELFIQTPHSPRDIVFLFLPTTLGQPAKKRPLAAVPLRPLHLSFRPPPLAHYTVTTRYSCLRPCPVAFRVFARHLPAVTPITASRFPCHLRSFRPPHLLFPQSPPEAPTAAARRSPNRTRPFAPVSGRFPITFSASSRHLPAVPPIPSRNSLLRPLPKSPAGLQTTSPCFFRSHVRSSAGSGPGVPAWPLQAVERDPRCGNKETQGRLSRDLLGATSRHGGQHNASVPNNLAQHVFSRDFGSHLGRGQVVPCDRRGCDAKPCVVDMTVTTT